MSNIIVNFNNELVKIFELIEKNRKFNDSSKNYILVDYVTPSTMSRLGEMGYHVEAGYACMYVKISWDEEEI